MLKENAKCSELLSQPYKNMVDLAFGVSPINLGIAPVKAFAYEIIKGYREPLWLERIKKIHGKGLLVSSL